MKCTLHELGADGHTASHALEPPGPILIGRGKDCPIRLEETRISRHHCLLILRGESWYIEDLGSTNGTKVNDQPVRHAKLAGGDVVTIGRARLLVEIASTAPVDAAPTPAAPVEPDTKEKLDAEVTRELAAARDAESLPPPPPAFAGRYELLQLLHHGSSGAFHRAKDLKHRRTVCLKLLSASLTEDEPEMRRFVRGVQAAAKLRHQNIVRLFRAGRFGPQWYMAMELVDGPSLRQVVARYGVGNMLAPTRVLAIARDIAAALEVAYERQVLHRNIRPENILLTKKGVAKLADFTLARGVALSTMQRITASSEVVGDLAFMAPERIEPDGTVDCRSDVYALGACLYTLLTGRPPFKGRGTVDLIEQIRHTTPPPPTRLNLGVPGPLEAVVMKCLARNSEDRFASPMELREELSRVARFQGMWS